MTSNSNAEFLFFSCESLGTSPGDEHSLDLRYLSHQSSGLLKSVEDPREIPFWISCFQHQEKLPSRSLGIRLKCGEFGQREMWECLASV
jgi:hypothetical protein